MLHRKLLPLAIFLVAATSANRALADISIGAEAGALYTLNTPVDKGFGFGFAGRLGYDIDLAIIHLIPEVKVAYERIPLFENTNVLRPQIGLRASIGIAVIAIVGFAHVGYAARLGGGEGQIDASGLVYEFGGGLDFTALPLIDIGIWGSFNQIRADDPFDWIGFGAHITLTI
jgi:hypothetical protein